MAWATRDGHPTDHTRHTNTPRPGRTLKAEQPAPGATIGGVVTVVRRRGGPAPYLRRQCPPHVKAADGQAMHRLVYAEGHSIRSAAAVLGLTPTTAWRRFHWWSDWILPEWVYGQPRGPYPPQRSSRACPRGRPWLPTLDDPGRRRGASRFHTLDPWPMWGDGERWCGFLWGVSSVGRRLGVCRQQARALTLRDGWPPVEVVLSGRRLWRDVDVEDWISVCRPWLADPPPEPLIRSPWEPGRRPPPLDGDRRDDGRGG